VPIAGTPHQVYFRSSKLERFEPMPGHSKHHREWRHDCRARGKQRGVFFVMAVKLLLRQKPIDTGKYFP